MVLGKMAVRNLPLFVCLLTSTITMYAQRCNLHIDNDECLVDTSE